jgi:protein subunit release factor A
MDLSDLKTESFPLDDTVGMGTHAIGSGVKITHKPTGLWSICDIHRSQYLNRNEALANLEDMVEEHG